MDDRFRNAGRYGWSRGYASAFPNFHEANYGKGVVHGTLLLPSLSVEFRDVRRSELLSHDSGATQLSRIPAVVRAVNRWAGAHGFAGGFPTFEQADYGSGVVYGALLIRPLATVWRDVPLTQIGATGVDDVPQMMRGASDYASSAGYAAGYPTFEEADHGHGRVVGVHLFRSGAATWRDVYADVLAMQGRYTFNADFSPAERQIVMERWGFAYERLLECGSVGGTVTSGNKSRVVTAFRKSISHTMNAPATANAQAIVNGSSIDLNRANFYGLIPREQAQTLLHEMTHCAGFTHPNRRDCLPPSPPTCVRDVPGDNGPYYGTVPLQAELCIAGVQSDAQCAPTGGQDDTPTEFSVGPDTAAVEHAGASYGSNPVPAG